MLPVDEEVPSVIDDKHTPFEQVVWLQVYLNAVKNFQHSDSNLYAIEAREAVRHFRRMFPK